MMCRSPKKHRTIGRNSAPTLVTSCTSLPPEGAGLAWGGPALRPFLGSLYNFLHGGFGLATHF